MNIRSGCLILLIALVGATCTRRAPTPQPIPETPARIIWNPNEIFVGLIQAGSGDEWHDANTASIRYLARQLDLPLKVTDAQFRPGDQITAFRNYVQDPDVNVIVVNAIEPTGWFDLISRRF